ncbi:hypothetical protein CPB85DRAFT_1336643 [Mucidula mucida]|nr:hypothetical protein CPB85DRAFT_1336643 [Mucidula mucida]
MLIYPNIALEFDPTLLLQVVLPQSTGASIALAVGPSVVATCRSRRATSQDPNIQVRRFLGGNFISGSPACEAELLVHIPLIFKRLDAYKEQTFVYDTTPLFNISAFAGAVGLGNSIVGNFVLIAPGPA